MSSSRLAQNPNRQTRKVRQDVGPWNKRGGKTNDRSRVDHEKYRSDYDLSHKDSKDDLSEKNRDFKDKDRKKKEIVNQTNKPTRLAKSPRRISKEQVHSNNDRRISNQRREIKIKSDSKDKSKEKKSDNFDRHPLFQDNSRLALLIAQITSAQEDASRRVTASQSLLEYVYDSANLEAVKRNCSNIFSALEDILKDRGHNELKDNIIHCYASIGHVLGIDCDKFFQWVFSKIPSAANDQLRVLYLRTISESVKLDVGKQIFYDTMPLIMASLQDVLENADSPDLLLVILEILSIIARDYPHIFAEYFRDTVDILVGWHIDTTQAKELTNKTAECLVSFQVYWVSDMRFSLTLLGQFLEDMEAYAEELSSINLGELSVEDTPSPFVSLPKLTALTRVFTTVIAGLGDFFSPGREAKITSAYIIDTVNRIITCVDICGYDLKFEQILIAANDCLRVMVSSLGRSISVSCMRIVTFVNDQLKNKKLASYKLHLSALLLIEKLITVVSQEIPNDVITELIDDDKPLLKIRCFVNEELLGLILKIFQLLLGIKNITLLEVVYKLFLKDITSAYDFLLESIKHETSNQLIEAKVDNDKDSKEEKTHDDIAVKNAYKVLIFDLAALSEIAVFKSSITGAWKVTPSTFTLLTTIINPTNTLLMERYPDLRYSILTTLLCHSQRCNNFIPSAKTKTQPNSVESTALLEMLNKILKNSNTTSQVKCLCACWFGEIISSIAALPMDTQKRKWNLNPVIESLICLLYDTEPSVQAQATSTVTRITRTGLIHPVILTKLLAESLPHLTNLDKGVFDIFWLMTVSFPADLLASLPTVSTQLSKMRFIGPNSSTQATCKKDIWRLSKIQMCRNPTGNLHSYAFRLIMKTLLCGPESNIDEKAWMSKLFSMCQRLGKTQEPVCGDFLATRRIEQSPDYIFPNNLSKMDSLLWFYFTWITAEYCVINKLKTPLGKASDTFQTIEGVIKELRNNFKEKDTSVKPPLRIKKKNVVEEEVNFVPEPSRSSVLQQAVLLLQFLENLEKFMYNAYEGTTTSLPQLSRPVRTFFRTNRSTCLEWLHRIQENVAVLANLCGCPEKAVRSGFIWLQHLQKYGNTQGSEFERAMVTVVDALMQLHCYESVQGLLEWSRKIIGRNFYWLYASTIKAKGSLESAADQFKTGLTSYLSPDRSKIENINEIKKPAVTVLTKDPVIHAESMSVEFLVDQVTDCYLQLCDWTEVQEWNKQVNELHKKFPSVQGLKSTVDHSYVKAMMKFDEHDFPGLQEQLELLPGAKMSNILQEQFPVLGAVKEEKDSKTSKHSNIQNKGSFFSHNSTPRAMLCQSRVYLMQALTLYWTSGLNTLKGSRVGSLHSSAWEAVDDLLNRAIDSSFAPVHTLLCNQSSKSNVSYLMQLKSISAIRETLMVTDNIQDSNSIFINVYGRSQYINPHKTDISILNEALRTASYLQYHHSLHKKGWVGPAPYSTDKLPNVQTLQVMTAKLARKQGNKKLAESLLAKQLSLLESKGALDGKMYLTGGAQLKLKQLSASVSSGKVVDPLAAVDILKESAKLKRTLGNISEAVDVLCSSILLSERQLAVSSNKLHNNFSKLSEVSARSFVTLAKWILTEPRLLSPVGEADEAVTVGPKVREVIKAISKSTNSTTKFAQNNAFVNLMSEGVLVCGQILHHSTYRCPTLGKTWFSYADWCYKWGRKIVEQESFTNQIDLIDDEKEAVINLLPKGTPINVVEKIYSVLTRAHCLRNKLEENDLSSSAVLEEVSLENEQEKVKYSLLHAVEDELNLSKDCLEGLVGIWKNIIERLFSHYKQAATAYLTYLKISGSETLTYDDFSKRSDYGNITATLRLLRLLVKYSGELKEHMEVPLSQTPTTPWRNIIPQLFARLNHPESYVQSSVANLLCRIARDSPQLIVYPTVVGCTDMMPQQQLSKTSAAGILRAYQYAVPDEFEQQPDMSPDEIEVGSQVDVEESDSQDEQPVISVEEKQIQSALHTILDTLTEDSPVLVQEVKCVIQELRRITLLWDELWLGSLTQLHQEAQRRMQQLQSEINRVNTNRTLTEPQKMLLIREKHSALMKPLIYALERLHKITSQVPETPHEQAFQKQFGVQILQAIDSLKMPIDPSKPELSWSGAKQLYQTLQMRAQKRLNNLVMSEASPVLAQKKFNLIPLPGLDRNGEEMISLSTFSNDMQVLPTKTKPKKLVMIGSDGQRYPYLFKGLEDLHLDERIMQFLEICNHMFAKEDKSGERKYFARHYSVTPLGPRSGLIQWVDGATPLFTLYRRWQQREAAAQAILKNQGDKNLPITIQPPSRPTELFFNKINPLLQEKGIEHNSSRKDWPLTILKKVLHDLSEETPNHLLSQELWCSSINAADWWNITQSYACSVAVMSMIGYVIGLGDRHLDNIMVDLTTGEVVHIDYNVCFEKGKALRVPEKVPFRLTRNMQNALGVTGVEGIFRSSCESVMSSLRSGREILLTLLEAFVYDPLIDWTTANDAAFAGAFYGGGAGGLDGGNKFSRKEMERGITQTLLSTRVAEMKVAWSANKEELLASLDKLKQYFESYCAALNNQKLSNDELVLYEQQVSILKAALIKADHPLHTLQSRYDKQAKLLENLKYWKQKMQEKRFEIDQMQNQFQTGFMSFQGNHIANLYNEICKLADIGPPSFSAAANFLNNAGQSNIVSQCEHVEAELAAILNQRRGALRACLDSLLSYSSVVSQFSSEYIVHHSFTEWIPLFSYILDEPTVSKCKQVLSDHAVISKRKATILKDAETMSLSLETKLHQYFSEQNNKLLKLYERRSHEQVETSSLSGPVTETWNGLRRFIGEAGSAGATSLACVTVTALTTLNKRQLFMENTAAGAGERLMHLTSREGDWFLDELTTMCSNISQLLSVLKNNALRSTTQKSNISGDIMENISYGMQVVFAAVKAYTSLQELMSNFRTIIVPEALKCFLNNDNSIFQITEKIRTIIDSLQYNPQVLCDHYQKALKDKSNVGDEITNIIDNLKSRFEQLSEPKDESLINDNDEGGTSTMQMSAGQMLLAGFSGLFNKVEAEISSLYEANRKMKTPDGFDHIDLQQEQKNMKASKIISNSLNSKWSNFLFIKKLIVIHGFFDSAIQQTYATREVDNAMHLLNAASNEDIPVVHNSERSLRVFNEELLCLPVKQFIAECVQNFIIGIPSQALTNVGLNYVALLAPNVSRDARDSRKALNTMEDICKRLVDYSLKSSAFPHQHLSQASALINAHDTAWRKHDLARRLDASIIAQKEAVQRAQLQLARFQWFYEEFLANSKLKKSLANPSKVSIINEIKKRLHAVSQIEHQGLPALMERNVQLQSSIEQRLKWASGANPALNTVLQKFDQAVNERKSYLLEESKLTREIINIAGSIVKMEAFKSSMNEKTTFEQTAVSIVQKCEESCNAFESCMGDLGDVELLMNRLQIPIPPKEAITIDWMKSRLELLDKKVNDIYGKEASLKNAILTERECLKGQVSSIKGTFTSHHNLVGEVKNMLKALAKDEEAEECLNVRQFIQAQNLFSEDSSIILKKILSLSSSSRGETDDSLKLTEEDSFTTLKMMDELVNNVVFLHDQLLLFGSNTIHQAEGSGDITNEDQESFASALQKVGDSGLVSNDVAFQESQGDGGGKSKINEVFHLPLNPPTMVSPTNTNQKTNATSPKKKLPAVPIRDPKTGKALQEKNSYALNVWKRVKAKLEGRDLDPSRRVAVSEQVGHVVEEAISLDNLAQLYEGWTPWV